MPLTKIPCKGSSVLLTVRLLSLPCQRAPDHLHEVVIGAVGVAVGDFVEGACVGPVGEAEGTAVVGTNVGAVVDASSGSEMT